jgi:hypothetical protein
MQGQLPGQFLQRTTVLDHQALDGGVDLVLEAPLQPGRHGFDVVLEVAPKLAVGARHSRRQPVGAEYQRGAIGVEHDRRLEEVAIGAHVVRRRMPEVHFHGLPGGSAQAEHDVAADCHRRVAHGNGALGVGVENVVAQHGHMGPQLQRRGGAAVVHVHVGDECVDGSAHIRSVLDQIAERAERFRATMPPDQQAEMGASAGTGAGRHQGAKCPIGNGFLRILENPSGESQCRDDRRQIDLQFPHDTGQGSQGCGTNHALLGHPEGRGEVVVHGRHGGSIKDAMAKGTSCRKVSNCRRILSNQGHE